MCKIVGFVIIIITITTTTANATTTTTTTITMTTTVNATNTTIYRGVEPPVDPFLSQVFRSLWNGLSWFLLRFGLWLFSILSNLLWAFCLSVATNFFFIPVFCPKLGLILLHSLCLFCNICKCILLLGFILVKLNRQYILQLV